MIRQCIILCGGYAKRMYPYTKETAKSMLLINDRPFIDYQLRLLKKYGVTSIILCTSHLAWQIRDYIKNGDLWKLRVKYVHDEHQLGTGGAVYKARDYMYSNFFVWYGDSYCDTDLSNIHSDFKSRAIVFKNSDKYDPSKIMLKGDKVVRYDKNGCGSYIDVFYAFNKNDLLSVLRSECDLSDALVELIKLKKLYAYKISERFYEIGKKEGYDEFKKAMGDSS